MPDREYIQRRSYSNGRYGRTQRKKTGPPAFFILLLLLLLVIVLVVVVLAVSAARGKSPQQEESSVPTAAGIVESPSPSPSQAPSSSGDESLAGPTSSPALDEPEPEVLDGLLRAGNTCYEYFNFSEASANSYITAVSEAGEELSDSTLYVLLAPTSMDVMLSEEYLQKYNVQTSNQKQAIRYVYESIQAMNPDVVTVPLFDALQAHRDEYLYFRTDRNWTQLGAYYAYVEFCKARGLTPIALDQYDKKAYAGFLGSFYSQAGNDAMQEDPDTVEAYLPNIEASMYILQANGEEVENWSLIRDGDNYDVDKKYRIFAGGDQPYSVITNAGLEDGSSCIVVKGSYGNAFLPFLAQHYETVYVADYRFYNGDVSSLAAEHDVKDVILLNDVTTTRSPDLVSTLDSVF